MFTEFSFLDSKYLIINKKIILLLLGTSWSTLTFLTVSLSFNTFSFKSKFLIPSLNDDPS